MAALVVAAFAVPTQAFAASDPTAIGSWGQWKNDANEAVDAAVPEVLSNKVVQDISASGVQTASDNQAFALALTEDGAVFAWGRNNQTQSTVPTSLKRLDADGNVLDGKAVEKISAGFINALALTEDDAVVTWGATSMNRATVPASLRRLDADGNVLDGKAVKEIAAGSGHLLAVTEDGEVAVWGSTTGPTAVPNTLKWIKSNGSVNTNTNAKAVRAVAAGNQHSLALTTEGAVVAWGNTNRNQNIVPDSIKHIDADGTEHDGKAVTAIAEGFNHCLALTEDGEVVAWGGGTNEYGQTTVNSSLKRIDADGTEQDGDKVEKIAAGLNFSLALTESGKVVSWGIEDDDRTDVLTSLTGKDVRAIAAGSTYGLALANAVPLTTQVNSGEAVQVKVGEETTVTVEVDNPNINTQTLSSLTVSVPDGFTYVENSSSVSAPTVNGNELTFANLGAIDEDDQLTLTFKLLAPDDVATGDVSVTSGQTASGVEVETSSAQLTAVKPLLTGVLANPAQIKVGEETTVTVEVDNPNLIVQTLEELKITIPDGFTYVDDSSSSSEPTVNGNELTFANLGAIDEDDQLTLTFKLLAPDDVAKGDVSVTSGQTGSVVEVTPSNPSATLVALVPLTTAVSVDPPQVKVGEETTVTVEVDNPNLIVQTLDELTVTIPDGFTYVDDSSSSSEPTGNGNELTFANLDAIDAGAQLTLTFKLQAATVAKGEVAVTSAQTASIAEVILPTTTPLLSAVDSLPTTVSVDPEQVTVGDTTTVTVGVTNPNLDAQTLEELKVTVPDGFTYVTDSSSSSEPTVDGNELTFTNLGTLDAVGEDGDELTFTFEVQATAVTSGDVAVTSGETDSVAEVEPSDIAQLSAVEPETPSTETADSKSPTSSAGDTSDELPQTGDSASPAAALTLAAAATLATGAALALARRAMPRH